eukprot:4032471-Karenia_brevis.AAC.1
MSAMQMQPEVGQCYGQTSGWGKVGDCLSNDWANNFRPGKSTIPPSRPPGPPPVPRPCHPM